MSIKIMSQVWDMNIQDPTIKLTLMALADFSDDDGYCFPSYQKVAEKISKSRPTAIRAINKLIEIGYLEKDIRERKDGGNTSNSYRVNTLTRESTSDNGGSMYDTRGSTGDTRGSITGDTPINITTNIEPSLNHQDNHHLREGVCENRNASSPPQKNPSSKISKFKKPSLEEIKAYIKEQSLKVDSNVFYDHYESVGWAIGRNKMKDWRATLRNWHRRESGFKPNVSKGKFESSMSEEERNYYMGDSDIITPYNYATKGLGLKHD